MFYLKYRPQTISELDNERIKETLGKALLDNNWAHAYLLIGTRGSGKTTTARLIAKIVNCTKRKKGEEPCNDCDSCKAITASESLDVIEIDAASNTGVDDIRDLREKVKLAPSRSKYKVYIIDEVHMLSTSAFNALLKTLEEPPEHVIFVLATTDPQKIPATVVSRCLVFDFGKASIEEIVSSVKRKIKKEKLEVGDEVLEKIAILSHGSFRDADKLLEQLAADGGKITLSKLEKFENSSGTSEAVEKIINGLIKQKAKDALSDLEKYVEKNGRVKELIVEMIEYLRNVLLLRNGLKIEAEEVDITTERIKKLIGDLLEASTFVKDSPVAQLPLEMVIIDYCSGPAVISENNAVKKTEESDKGIRLLEKKEDQHQSGGLQNSSVSDITSKWQEILNATKGYNHSITAFLRAGRAREIKNGFLIIEVFYKFHKEKLDEKKNREIVEKVISDIMGTEMRVRFELAEKK